MAGPRAFVCYPLPFRFAVEGSRKNIEEHYDAGNDMYKLFLDETMTYSCGIHREGESLEQAQYNKLDAMIQRVTDVPRSFLQGHRHRVKKSSRE